MGVLSDAVLRRMRRYYSRRHDIIYAHMLEKSVWYWIYGRERKPEEEVNGYMIIGELLHQALPLVLGTATEKCRTLWLEDYFLEHLHPRVRDRFVKYRGSHGYVEVCGSADAVIHSGNGEEIPVELKTTRRNISKIPWQWLQRCNIYSWLYDSEKTLLIIVNIIDATEKNIEVYGDHEKAVNIIKRWLEAKHPVKAFF